MRRVLILAISDTSKDLDELTAGAQRLAVVSEPFRWDDAPLSGRAASLLMADRFWHTAAEFRLLEAHTYDCMLLLFDNTVGGNHRAGVAAILECLRTAASVNDDWFQPLSLPQEWWAALLSQNHPSELQRNLLEEAKQGGCSSEIVARHFLGASQQFAADGVSLIAQVLRYVAGGGSVPILEERDVDVWAAASHALAALALPIGLDLEHLENEMDRTVLDEYFGEDGYVTSGKLRDELDRILARVESQLLRRGHQVIRDKLLRLRDVPSSADRIALEGLLTAIRAAKHDIDAVRNARGDDARIDS
jgi:hypothetical protein